jgi:hypothetical protein
MRQARAHDRTFGKLPVKMWKGVFQVLWSDISTSMVGNDVEYQ